MAYVAIIYLGMFLYIIAGRYSFQAHNTEEILSISFKILPIAVMMIGVGYFLFGYLEGNKTNDRTSERVENNSKNTEQIVLEFRKFFEELRHYQEKGSYETRELVERLRHQLEQQKELHLDEKQRSELFNSLKQSFAENINEDFFKQLSENVSIEITKEKRGRLDFLLKDFSAIKIRIGSEIEKLNRKANVNLVIGSLTTIVALIALSFLVFQTNSVFNGYSDLLYHYIPRLSLIIFIEVFAFFFLKLYKLNLNDMKYFQNELTTVELKLASITTAINFGKDIDISAITLGLSKTERNFILKKGETTVDLEKSRIDKTDMKEILKSITDIANRRK